MISLEVKSRLQPAKKSSTTSLRTARNQPKSTSINNLASSVRPKNRSMSKTKKRDSSRSNSKSTKKHDLKDTTTLKVPEIEKPA